MDTVCKQNKSGEVCCGGAASRAGENPLRANRLPTSRLSAGRFRAKPLAGSRFATARPCIAAPPSGLRKAALQAAFSVAAAALFFGAGFWTGPASAKGEGGAGAVAGAGGAGAASAAPKPNFLEQFFPFILIGLVFYLLIIRPQQKKARRHDSFLGGLKKGDEVITASGLFGKIEGLTDRFVILEIAENIRVRVLKSKIASLMKDLENPTEQGSSGRSAGGRAPSTAGAPRGGASRSGLSVKALQKKPKKI